MANLKTYIVKFDTQKNRMYSNWEFITEECNKKAAVSRARELWLANGHTAHMFHCEAVRSEVPYSPAYYQRFTRVDWKPVTWGKGKN